MTIETRRGFIRALGFVACAPAIVRVASLMPVRSYDDVVFSWGNYEGPFEYSGFESKIPIGSIQEGAWVPIVRRAFVPKFYCDLLTGTDVTEKVWRS
jgi:hypothetical protein